MTRAWLAVLLLWLGLVGSASATNVYYGSYVSAAQARAACNARTGGTGTPQLNYCDTSQDTAATCFGSTIASWSPDAYRMYCWVNNTSPQMAYGYGWVFSCPSGQTADATGLCVSPVVMCEWNEAITADDPTCAGFEPCQYNSAILTSDAMCVAPTAAALLTCAAPNVLNAAHNACISPDDIDWSLTSTAALVFVASMVFAFFIGLRAGLVS